MLHPTQDLHEADFQGGSLLLFDKPKGWTSFDVVNKVRYTLQKHLRVKNLKVGHSGTLDPMATGLLLICTGKWTKALHELQGFDKKYEGEITLGTTTDSYDAEGKVIAQTEVPALTMEDIQSCLASFEGEIDQYPPVFSAIKKEGKKLYELARAGKEITVESRRVRLYSASVLQFASPRIEFSVHCGTGFYVRSLAHDLGTKLGCGAHLSGLRRTAIGDYLIDQAFSLDEFLGAMGTNGTIQTDG